MGMGDHIGEPVDSHGNYPDGTPAAPSYAEQQQIDASAAADAEQQKQIAAQQAAAAQAAAAKAADDQYKSHYEYGGWAGGAAEATNRYAGLGAAAQGRQGEQLALGAANEDRYMGLGARQGQLNAAGGQFGMAGLLAGRANGSMPLISGMRANQDINRALADQSSIAASARGPAALALAQQQQANQSAAAMGNISNTAQINGAQEQINNTVAAGNAYGQAGQAMGAVRGGDQALMGADTGISVAQAQINAAQREANDRYQLGMTGYETGVQGAQLQAQGNQIAGERGAYATQQGIDLAHDQNSTAKTGQVLGVVGGVGGGVAAGVTTALLSSAGGKAAPTTGGGTPGVESGSIAGGNGAAAGADEGSGAGGVGTSAGDPSGASSAGTQAGAGGGAPYDPYAKANGGPVDAGHPYLVGERGPELIVPQRSGFVIPAGPTSGLMRSDANAKNPTTLSTTHDDTTGPASSSVSMARMLAARDAQAERKASAERWGAIAGNAVGGLGRAFAQPAPVAVARIDTTQPQMHPISVQPLSDDKTKLAAAWDQGHSAALSNVEKVSRMPAAEMKASTRPEAAAVRALKADAWDEGQRNGMAAALRRQEAAASPAQPPQLSQPSQIEQSARDVVQPRGAMLPEFGVGPMTGLRAAQGIGRAAEAGYGAMHAPRMAQQPGPTIAHTLAPSGDFDAQVRDQFGSPPPVVLQPTQASGEPDYFAPPPQRVATTSDAQAKNRAEGSHNISTALEERNGSISPETEAYMRREGMWGPQTDALLRQRGLRDPDVARGVDAMRARTTTSDAACKLSMSSMLGGKQVGTLGKEVSREDTADFARSLRSTPYTYKPSFAAREGQKPGEVNVGPVAQEIEKSKIGATIVKPDAQGSGMRTLDETKMVKGLGGVAAAHQDHLDELDDRMSLMARMLGGRR